MHSVFCRLRPGKHHCREKKHRSANEKYTWSGLQTPPSFLPAKEQSEIVIGFNQCIVELVNGPHNGLVFRKRRIERGDTSLFVVTKNHPVPFTGKMTGNQPQQAVYKYYDLYRRLFFYLHFPERINVANEAHKPVVFYIFPIDHFQLPWRKKKRTFILPMPIRFAEASAPEEAGGSWFNTTCK